jgi:hypothetical protein
MTGSLCIIKPLSPRESLIGKSRDPSSNIKPVASFKVHPHPLQHNHASFLSNSGNPLSLIISVGIRVHERNYCFKMSFTTPPDAAAVASRPCTTAPGASNPEIGITQKEPGNGAEVDPKISSSIGNLDLRLPDGEKRERESLELPILKPDSDGTDVPENGGAKRELPSEIPDTDAPSPFSSQVQVVGPQEGTGGVDFAANQAGLGGEDGGVKDTGLVAGGKSKDVVMDGEAWKGTDDPDATTMIQEALAKEPVLGSDAHTATGIGVDADGKDLDYGDGIFLPSRDSGVSHEPPTYFGPKDVQNFDNLVPNQQKVLLLSHPFAVEVPECPTAEESQDSTAVEERPMVANKEENLEDSSHSPMEDSVRLETASLDEVDMLVVEDSLPTEKTSFLQQALEAEEVQSVQETSTSPQETPSTIPPMKVQRTEIPASDDDEDAMDEDTDPSTNIYELRATHGSASEVPDTLFMSVPGAKQREEFVLLPYSTAEAEPRTIEGASTWKGVSVAVADDHPPSTDTAETITVSLAISELSQPKVHEEASVAEAMEVDVPEAPPVGWNFSSLIEVPTSSVNLPDPTPATQNVPFGAVDAGLADALPLAKEPEMPTEVSMSSNDPLVGESATSSAPAADLPEAATTCAHFSPGRPAIPASSDASDEQSTQEPAPTEEIPVSVPPCLPRLEGDAQAIKILSSPPKLRQSDAARVMPTLIPNASFTVPKGVLTEEDTKTDEVSTSPPKPKERDVVPTKPVITPSTSFAAPEMIVPSSKKSGKGKASSIATNPSQSREEGLSTPPKAGGGKGSMGPPESPIKDVLFEELKAMKIVRLIYSPPLSQLSFSCHFKY